MSTGLSLIEPVAIFFFSSTSSSPIRLIDATAPLISLAYLERPSFSPWKITCQSVNQVPGPPLGGPSDNTYDSNRDKLMSAMRGGRGEIRRFSPSNTWRNAVERGLSDPSPKEFTSYPKPTCRYDFRSAVQRCTELQTCRSNDVERNALGVRMDVDYWGAIGIGDCVKQRFTKLGNHRMLIWA